MSQVYRGLAPTSVLAAMMACCAAAHAATEAPYPFEGTWIRAEHSCTPQTVRARTYTAREVVSPLGRCVIRRTASNGGAFELVEDCRRNDRPQTVTETIRMTSADSMTLKRQMSRLKIPRQLRYTRCTIASGAGQPLPSAHSPRPAAPELKPRP